MNESKMGLENPQKKESNTLEDLKQIPENLKQLHEHASKLIGHKVTLDLRDSVNAEVTGVVTGIEANTYQDPDDLVYILDNGEKYEIMHRVQAHVDHGPDDNQDKAV